jgi:hypothetical protein
VSATLQESGYVSMAGGGVGNGSISQLLALRNKRFSANQSQKTVLTRGLSVFLY